MSKYDYSSQLYERQLLRAATILAPTNSTATVMAGDLTAEAAVSKLTAPRSPSGAVPFSGAEVCACLAKKKPEFLVCRSCWWQAPLEVRHNIRFGAQPVKRGAIRMLLDFAHGRKVLRELALPEVPPSAPRTT
jgi:hypothetical protein